MRIIGFKGPWSGDIAQWISPVFSLVNIDIGHSRSPQSEEQILDRVGSYGRQIGRIGDALYALIEALKEDGAKPLRLNKNQQEAFEAFQVQYREVLKVKQEVEATTRQIKNPPMLPWLPSS
jgi:hypothetical protein